MFDKRGYLIAAFPVLEMRCPTIERSDEPPCQLEDRQATRVEFASQNDKLEQLLEAFRHAADQAPAVEEQTTIVVMEGTPPALPGSENGSR